MNGEVVILCDTAMVTTCGYTVTIANLEKGLSEGLFL